MTLPVLVGYSTRINSDSQLPDVVDILIRDKCNGLRYGAPYGSGTGRYLKSDVEYFLNNWAMRYGGVVVVDINHTYNESSLNWNTITEKCLMVCEDFPNNPRVCPEVANEISGQDKWAHIRDVVQAVRDAGYTNKLVWDKHWTSGWQNVGVDENGHHFYMNVWTIANIQRELQAGLDAGLQLLSTEVGAHGKESGSFTTNNVNQLNTMLDWCVNDKGIGALVWMNTGISNDSAYTRLGLDLPEGEPIWFDEPKPEPEPPVDLSNYYTKSQVDTQVNALISDLKTYVDAKTSGNSDSIIENASYLAILNDKTNVTNVKLDAFIQRLREAFIGV